MSELSALARQVAAATRNVSETVHRHVTVSTGNHGAGFAYALGALGGTGIVCVPEGASPVKVAAIQSYGIEVRVLGQGPAETEKLARDLADRDQLPYISPYNDLYVVAGQGTVGEEIVQQAGGRPVDSVVAAVGGAVSSPGSRQRSGTAGGVEQEAITLPLCTELVDEWTLVEESEIRSALRVMIDTEHQLVEGSAAVAIAAGLRAARRRPGRTIAVISCGANISSDVLAAAIVANP